MSDLNLTNHKDKLFFWIILALYIVYSFTFTYSNEPFFGFSKTLDYKYIFNKNLNSDFIWAYSFNRDILNGVNISNWSFPPNYHFLELVLSFIPTLISPNLDFYIFLISPIQILLLAFGLSYIQKKELNFFVNCSNIFLCTLTLFLFYRFFDVLLSSIFLKDFHISFFLEQLFHNSGTHSLSAILAVIIYYKFFIFENYNNLKIKFYILFFICSLSDIFFAVYLLSFLGIRFLYFRKILNFKTIILCFIISVVTIIITYLLNPSLKIHLSNSINITKETKDFVEIALLSFVLFLLPTIFFYFLNIKKLLTNDLRCLFYGCFLIHLFNVSTGLTQNFFSIKYSAIIVPVTILFASILIKQLNLKQLMSLTFLNCFALFGFIINVLFFKPVSIFNSYDNEITCIEKIEKNKTYKIIATYWSGKIIFEKLDRKLSFIQITPFFYFYEWHYNNAWSDLRKESKNFGNFILISEGINPQTIKKLGNLANPYCNNKIYLIKNTKLVLPKE